MSCGITGSASTTAIPGPSGQRRKFAQQLDVLARAVRVLSLAELVRRLADGRPLGRAVVLTFDDGYADNLLVAKRSSSATACPPPCSSSPATPAPAGTLERRARADPAHR